MSDSFNLAVLFALVVWVFFGEMTQASSQD